jgi:hypothetical protein
MELILDFQTLQRVTEYTRVSDVARCLERQGIRFFYGRGGTVWTTIDLVNVAIGLKPSGEMNEQALDPEGFQ